MLSRPKAVAKNIGHLLRQVTVGEDNGLGNLVLRLVPPIRVEHGSAARGLLDDLSILVYN